MSQALITLTSAPHARTRGIDLYQHLARTFVAAAMDEATTPPDVPYTAQRTYASPSPSQTSLHQGRNYALATATTSHNASFASFDDVGLSSPLIEDLPSPHVSYMSNEVRILVPTRPHSPHTHTRRVTLLPPSAFPRLRSWHVRFMSSPRTQLWSTTRIFQVSL